MNKEFYVSRTAKIDKDKVIINSESKSVDEMPFDEFKRFFEMERQNLDVLNQELTKISTQKEQLFAKEKQLNADIEIRKKKYTGLVDTYNKLTKQENKQDEKKNQA